MQHIFSASSACVAEASRRWATSVGLYFSPRRRRGARPGISGGVPVVTTHKMVHGLAAAWVSERELAFSVIDYSEASL